MDRTDTTFFLPDGLVIAVLQWLPVRDVVRLRLVSKNWRRLTLTPYFLEKHYRNNLPGLLVTQRTGDFELNVLAIDRSRVTGGSLYFQRFPDYSSLDLDYVLFSHAGLAVMLLRRHDLESPSRFIIVNPSRPRDEEVMVHIPMEYGLENIYGVYFQPSIGAYCLLLKLEVTYYVLILSYVPKLRSIINPLWNRERRTEPPPLLINNSLYWMLRSEFPFQGRNDIMVFHVISQEFHVLQCPIPPSVECCEKQTYLLNGDGAVCFIMIHPDNIWIWRLRDQPHELWVGSEYRLRITSFADFVLNRPVDFDGVGLTDRQIAFISRGILYVCNLTDGTYRKYPKLHKFLGVTKFVSHQSTLNSVSNCRRKIYILKEGDEGVIL